MTTSTAAHRQIKAWLEGAGLHVQFGPAKDLPAGADGRVLQAVVLWPAAPLHQYGRASGDSSGRNDRVVVTCVGATLLDSLAVADKVEAAVGGKRISANGGTLRQTASTSPAPEPNADPVRVSMAVEYSTVTKG